MSTEERQTIVRKAGAVHGNAHAAQLTSKRRSEIARLAAKVRWGKPPD